MSVRTQNPPFEGCQRHSQLFEVTCPPGAIDIRPVAALREHDEPSVGVGNKFLPCRRQNLSDASSRVPFLRKYLCSKLKTIAAELVTFLQ